MKRGYFITGTDTGVGKTVITALLASLFKKKGFKVAVYKPVESGGKLGKSKCFSLDAEFVRTNAEIEQPYEEMNTYCFKNAVSPHLAAELENEEIDTSTILRHFEKLKKNYDVVLIEGVGGLCVPIVKTEILIADLIKMLCLPIIIVARPTLGTINHTVLTVKCANHMGIEVNGIVMNYTQDINDTVVEKTNPKYIEEMTKVPILGIVPFVDFNSDEKTDIIKNPEKYIDYEKII